MKALRFQNRKIVDNIIASRLCEACNPILLQLHFVPPRSDDDEHFFVNHDFTTAEFAQVGKPREWDELDEIYFSAKFAGKNIVVCGG